MEGRTHHEGRMRGYVCLNNSNFLRVTAGMSQVLRDGQAIYTFHPYHARIEDSLEWAQGFAESGATALRANVASYPGAACAYGEHYS